MTNVAAQTNVEKTKQIKICGILRALNQLPKVEVQKKMTTTVS
jgi:hypothetical protein